MPIRLGRLAGLSTFRSTWSRHKPMPLELCEPGELYLGDDPPHDYIETQVFYLGYGRNAWHSTWTNKYYPNSISFSDIELKEIAEGRRVQGHVFKIEAMPMFVLKSESCTFGICEINNRSEYEYSALQKRIEGDRPSKFLSHFPGSDRNWLLVFNLQHQQIPLMSHEKYVLTSKSIGRQQSLRWEKRTVGDNCRFLVFCDFLLDKLTTIPEHNTIKMNHLTTSIVRIACEPRIPM
jgi:hypothetical protein